MTPKDYCTVALATLATFLFLCGVAFANQTPDCSYIKEQVKEHGKIKAYAWALASGYTPRDIARIRKLCNV